MVGTGALEAVRTTLHGGRQMEVPVRYAKSGDVHLAYRVFGDGPRDIVLIPGTLSHIELTWDCRPTHICLGA